MAWQRDFATVVSGVPRSGTSLVMQMLGAGGVPLLTDDARVADEDNPRGYFEYAPVKASARDLGWFARAPGRAVKVIHSLLSLLPRETELRIVFVERDLGEVLRSQARMLARAGAPAAGEVDEARLAEIFAGQIREALADAGRRPRVAVLRLEHRDLLERPDVAAARMAAFLGGGLDIQAMIRCVEPALHRNREES